MPEWPQPGWYFEPGGPQVARWWDGQSWGPYASPPPVVPTSDPYQQAAPWGSPHAQQTAVLQQPPPSPPAQWVPSTPTPRGPTSPGVRIGAVLGAVVLVVGFVYVWHQGDQPSHGQALARELPDAHDGGGRTHPVALDDHRTPELHPLRRSAGALRGPGEDHQRRRRRRLREPCFRPPRWSPGRWHGPGRPGRWLLPRPASGARRLNLHGGGLRDAAARPAPGEAR